MAPNTLWWDMEDKASKTRSVNIAFVADAELLRRLEVVLAEVSKALEYMVKYSDGTTVHYPDIEDVINQPNAKRHSIVAVTAAVVFSPLDVQSWWWLDLHRRVIRSYLAGLRWF